MSDGESGDRPVEGEAATRTPEREDLRPRAERRVRRAWAGRPDRALSVASVLFGAAADLRNYAYEAGLASALVPPVPVLSVGALTVGGVGKTPLAAEAARWIQEEGKIAAVVTRGFADEMAVHRRKLSETLVVGARRKSEGVKRAHEAGASVAVLDDGFQHRRLRRDLDWVALDPARPGGRRWLRLPAGPARDRWGELGRADAVVVVSRTTGAAGPEGGGNVAAWAARVGRQFPALAVARCELRPGGLRPVNAAARRQDRASPRVGFASVMKGEEFLDGLRNLCPSLRREYLFPDHFPVGTGPVDQMVREAGNGGMVGTLKDVVKVEEAVGARTPLWCVEEELVWREGRRALRSQLESLLRRA